MDMLSLTHILGSTADAQRQLLRDTLGWDPNDERTLDNAKTLTEQEEISALYMLASLGHPVAQIHYAKHCVNEGRIERAIEFFDRAAKQGKPFVAVAHYCLGEVYADGKKDLETAAFHSRRAAEEGHVGGMLSWGRALARGLGVAPDVDAARMYLEQARDKGRKPTPEELRQQERVLTISEIAGAELRKLDAAEVARTARRFLRRQLIGHSKGVGS